MNRLHLVLIAGLSLLFFSCGNDAKQKSESSADSSKVAKQTLVDANSGATGMGIVNLNVTPNEGRAKVVAFLDSCSIFYLSTVENGNPRVRPIGIFTDYDGKIWFHIGKQKGMYAQIAKNNHVEIAAMGSHSEWIRISGEAICDDNEEVYKMAVANTPSITSMYNKKTGLELGSFYIKDGVAEISKGNVIERFKF